MNSKYIYFILLGTWLSQWGCSLVLDKDVLQNDNTTTSDDTDSAPVQECNFDADCTDTVNCTIDNCSANHQCVHLANNALCAQFEVCEVQTGCVSTGNNCNEDTECNDKINCTVDWCQDNLCRNSPDNTACANSVPFCREDAKCIPNAGGCVEGAVIKCPAPDGICMAATCNPQTGDCEDHRSEDADKDSDSFLNSACGGNDCHDNNALTHPGATEICNGIDNNCDGTNDAVFTTSSPILVAQGAALNNPQIAGNEEYVAIIWEGDSLQTAFINTSNAVSLFDMGTLRSGTLSNASIIANPNDNTQFFVAFIAQENTNPMTLEVASITYNPASQQVTGAILTTLDTGITTVIADCAIAYDAQYTLPGWVVVWTENDATSSYVRIQNHNEATSFSFIELGSGALGQAGPVDLNVSGGGNYFVTFVANWENESSDDEEIFEALIQYENTYVIAQEATSISPVDEIDADPSHQPAASLDANGNIYTAFVDYTGFGNAKTISIWNSAQQTHMDYLPSATLAEINNLHFIFGGQTFGLFYLYKTTAATKFILQQLSSSGPGANLESISETNLYNIENGAASVYSDFTVSRSTNQKFALAWIQSTDAATQLQYLPLASCTAE